jgi:cyclase
MRIVANVPARLLPFKISAVGGARMLPENSSRMEDRALLLVWTGGQSDCFQKRLEGPEMSRIARVLLWVASILSLAAASSQADSIYSTERQVLKLVGGVYMIRHKDPFPGWVHGNTTVIIGERDVFVVDSCQTLSEARKDIAQIRQWTDKPVAFVLNTHWHQDHNAGNKAYVEAFPAVVIVAHPETKAMMELTSPRVAGEMLKQASEIKASLQKRLETGKGPDDKPLSDQMKADTKERLVEIESIIEEANHFVYQPPTLTFEQEMTIDLGGREVKVMHMGRGNTGGDAIAYLPKEKILATGDLVVSPVPYAFDGYPTEWIKTLEKLTAFDADTIVPGHGEVMHDKKYVNQLIALMKSIVAQVDAKVRANSEISFEEVKKAVDLKPFVEQMYADDKHAASFFNYSIGEKFVELAYHEAKAR